MPKNSACHALMPIPTVAIDCILAEMAGLGYCELLQDGTIFSVGATLMQHFPGKQKELRGKPWTELRRIPFLRDLDFDHTAVAECDWAGFWTGPKVALEGGTASWLIWRSDRVPGHVVIMVRPPANVANPSARKNRATRDVESAPAAEQKPNEQESNVEDTASDKR